VAVRTVPEADAQVLAIDEWWRQNRQSSPDLFLDELASAFDIIGHTPGIGRFYRQSSVPGTRRILLKGSGYHVYYVSLDADALVLSVWHARRGQGPPLFHA
jgi:plasmid stabilization system protein ParE